MGIALVIMGADYSAKNLGQVTPLQDMNVTALTISANDIIGLQGQPNVAYTPVATNQKGVTWSITTGSDYATINSSTGLITVLKTATTAQSITIKAVSNYDSSIVATKTINVTYKETVDSLDAINILGALSVSGSSTFSVAYTPANTSYPGVTWSIKSGSAYATINSSTGLLSSIIGANASAVTIQATSMHDASIVATKDITVTYAEDYWDLTNNVGYIKLDKSYTSTLYLELAEAVNSSKLAGKNDANCYRVLAKKPQTETSGDAMTALLGASNSFTFKTLPNSGTATGRVTSLAYLANSKGGWINSADKGGILSGDGTEYTGKVTLSSDNGVQNDSGYVCFNATSQIIRAHNIFEYETNALLTQAIKDGNVVPLYPFKIKSCIIYNSKEYNSVADIIANRASADIDIKFKGGKPYNAGTGNPLIFSEN